MPISQEIIDQLNIVLNSEPSLYRSPNYPDLELDFEALSWPIPNNKVSEIKFKIWKNHSDCGGIKTTRCIMR